MMNVGTAEGRELEDIVVRLLAMEREACAKLAGELANVWDDTTGHFKGREIAAAIRARGKEGT